MVSRSLSNLEKRQTKRCALSQKVIFETSTHLGPQNPVKSNPGPGPRFESRIKDVSEGGLCLLTKEPLQTSQIVKLNLPLPKVDITTPTLAEVRWVKKEASRPLYKAGLRFLF